MGENNTPIILKNDHFFDTPKRPDFGLVVEFARLENIRKYYTKLSVEFVAEHVAVSSDKERRKTRERTARQYLKGASSYFAFNPDGDITAQSARDWAAALAADGKQTTTQTALVGGCRRFFDWAIARLKAEMAQAADGAARLAVNMINLDNPCVGVKLDVVERLHRRDELGADGARRFERYLNSIAIDADGKTTRLMCLMELWAGCRSIELARLTVDDVRRGIYQAPAHVYLYRKGKTAKTAHAVPAALADMLRDAIDGRDGKEPLFVSKSNRNQGGAWNVKSIENRIRQAIENAGLKTDRISPHSLRHTNVNNMLRAGVSIEDVAAYEDHKSTATTMIYAHKVHELETQAAALDKVEAHRMAQNTAARRGRPKGALNKKKRSTQKPGARKAK
jgi:site-specific recombinase XerD